MPGGTPSLTEHRNHHSAPASRYGSLDVPLSVWQVADAPALTAGLLAEFKPARGPVVTIDVPGWEAIPKLARHALVLTRDLDAARAVLDGVPGGKQGLVRLQPVSEASLATRLGAIDRRTGLVIASVWLLACEGALSAVAAALAPEGFLAIVGRDMAGQTRLARAPWSSATHHRGRRCSIRCAGSARSWWRRSGPGAARSASIAKPSRLTLGAGTLNGLCATTRVLLGRCSAPMRRR